MKKKQALKILHDFLVGPSDVYLAHAEGWFVEPFEDGFRVVPVCYAQSWWKDAWKQHPSWRSNGTSSRGGWIGLTPKEAIKNAAEGVYDAHAAWVREQWRRDLKSLSELPPPTFDPLGFNQVLVDIQGRATGCVGVMPDSYFPTEEG